MQDSDLIRTMNCRVCRNEQMAYVSHIWVDIVNRLDVILT